MLGEGDGPVAGSSIAAPASQAEGASSPSITVVILALSLTQLFTVTAYLEPSPFLVDLSSEFDMPVGSLGQLVALASITWGLVGVMIGPVSDRIGRQPILIGGALTVGVAGVAGAFAPSYLMLLATRLVLGIGGGVFTPNAYALIADFVPAARRGRAYGIQLTGSALASVVGIPILSLAGAHVGWRVAFGSLGVALLVMGFVLWRALPRRHRDQSPAASDLAAKSEPVTRRVEDSSVSMLTLLRHRPMLLLLGANLGERTAFGAFTTFLAAFLIQRYGLRLDEVALYLALIASGGVVGNLVGGRLSDRLPRATLYVVCEGLAGLLILGLFAFTPSLVFSTLIGFAFGAINAGGYASLIGLVGDIEPTARGKAMGLWTLANNGGWLAGGALGGFVIVVAGYSALGVYSLVGLALASVLAYTFHRTSRVGVEPANSHSSSLSG